MQTAMKLLFAIPLILAATAIRSAAQTIPLVTDSLSTIDPVEIRFSPLKREITETVIPYLKSINYGPDKFYLRVSAYHHYTGAPKSSAIFTVQLCGIDSPFSLRYNKPFGYCRIGGYLCLFCNELLRQYVGPLIIPDPSDVYYVYTGFSIISWYYLLVDDSLLPIGIW